MYCSDSRHFFRVLSWITVGTEVLFHSITSGMCGVAAQRAGKRALPCCCCCCCCCFDHHLQFRRIFQKQSRGNDGFTPLSRRIIACCDWSVSLRLYNQLVQGLWRALCCSPEFKDFSSLFGLGNELGAAEICFSEEMLASCPAQLVQVCYSNFWGGVWWKNAPPRNFSHLICGARCFWVFSVFLKRAVDLRVSLKLGRLFSLDY